MVSEGRAEVTGAEMEEVAAGTGAKVAGMAESLVAAELVVDSVVAVAAVRAREDSAPVVAAFADRVHLCHPQTSRRPGAGRSASSYPCHRLTLAG